MMRKDLSSCLFGACTSPIKPQKEVLVTSPEDFTALKRKEIKMSLKQKNRKSIQTNLSITQHLSTLKSNEEYTLKIQSSNKQNNFNSNLSFNSPSEKQNNEKNPLNSKLAKTTLKKHSINPSRSSLLRAPKKEQQNASELQRTTKLYSTDLKSTQNQGQLMQTKQLNKQNFISRLEDFKQSIVSINEVETLRPKLEESTVMIDFFHPTQDKVLELQNYLIQRT